MVQEQLKLLEDEARARILADNARSERLCDALDELAGKVRDIKGRIDAGDAGLAGRVSHLEVTQS